MGTAFASPTESPLWGWRRMVRWYVGAGLVAALAGVLYGADEEWGLGRAFGPGWEAAEVARSGQAFLATTEECPHLDPATGLVVLPAPYGEEFAARWNAGVAAVLARTPAAVAPRYSDRLVDPVRLAAEFASDPGDDVGDGTAGFRAADRLIRVERYDADGCGTGMLDTLRRGSRTIDVGNRILRVYAEDGGRVRGVEQRVARGVNWFPRLDGLRARTSADGRTLWLRGLDADRAAWLVTVDLVSGTVIQADPEPER